MFEHATLFLLFFLLIMGAFVSRFNYFSTDQQTRKKLKTQKRATNFLNPPTEKSFNRGQNLRPKGKT